MVAFNTTEIDSFKNQLFENYYTGISLDLKLGKKRIINDIKLYEVFSSTAKQVASIMIDITYINYTIDKKEILLSGSRNQKITEKFEVIFRKDYEKDEINNCPNCCAVLKGNKCEFCNIPIKKFGFKISSIKIIIDN